MGGKEKRQGIEKDGLNIGNNDFREKTDIF